MGVIFMPRKKNTAEFKTKVVLSILQGDKEFNEICAEHNLNPNMVRKWKQDFLKRLRASLTGMVLTDTLAVTISQLLLSMPLQATSNVRSVCYI